MIHSANITYLKLLIIKFPLATTGFPKIFSKNWKPKKFSETIPRYLPKPVTETLMVSIVTAFEICHWNTNWSVYWPLGSKGLSSLSIPGVHEFQRIPTLSDYQFPYFLISFPYKIIFVFFSLLSERKIQK